MNKGLDALERLRNTLLAEGYWQDILQDVSIIEKDLKALEIIKTKLLAGCFSKEDNYSNYAMAIMMSGNETLKKNMMTEQEYDLSREVLL